MTRPIRLVLQRTKRDCSVACLASITGQSYEKTLMAFRHPVYDQGASSRQILDAARRMGVEPKWSRKYDLENDQGMLAVRSELFQGDDHLVLLISGHIIDLDDPASLWEADDYLEAFQARVLSIITVSFTQEGEEQ